MEAIIGCLISDYPISLLSMPLQCAGYELNCCRIRCYPNLSIPKLDKQFNLSTSFSPSPFSELDKQSLQMRARVKQADEEKQKNIEQTKRLAFSFLSLFMSFTNLKFMVDIVAARLCFIILVRHVFLFLLSLFKITHSQLSTLLSFFLIQFRQ